MKNVEIRGHQLTPEMLDDLNRCPYCSSSHQRIVNIVRLVKRGEELQVHARCSLHRNISTWDDADEVILLDRGELALIQVMTS